MKIPYSRPQIVSLTIMALLVMAQPLTAAETIVDNIQGFSLKLPHGFTPNSQLVNAAPNIIHAFVLGDPNDDEMDIFLFIEKLRGTIGRERLKPENMPPGFQGQIFATTWQGFAVDAFEVPERVGETETITYNVQIPLKRAAIQVKLFGPAAHKSVLDRLLKEVLDGLTGDSNWMSSASPASPLTSSENYGRLLLAAAIVVILGGLVVLFLVSRKAPKGTVLAIAAAIYLASFAIGGIRIREVVMLSGALRMLGFAGGILGIVDLLRKRKPRAESSRQRAHHHRQRTWNCKHLANMHTKRFKDVGSRFLDRHTLKISRRPGTGRSPLPGARLASGFTSRSTARRQPC